MSQAHLIGLYLTGVRLMVVHPLGLYLMGVHLIDADFMDVYIQISDLTNGGAIVDLSRSKVAKYEFLR
jgi:hypothetical protein